MEPVRDAIEKAAAAWTAVKMASPPCCCETIRQTQAHWRQARWLFPVFARRGALPKQPSVAALCMHDHQQGAPAGPAVAAAKTLPLTFRTFGDELPGLPPVDVMAATTFRKPLWRAGDSVRPGTVRGAGGVNSLIRYPGMLHNAWVAEPSGTPLHSGRNRDIRHRTSRAIVVGGHVPCSICMVVDEATDVSPAALPARAGDEVGEWS